ncbi:hypothetical protein T492DRAFT_1124367 [Pavlovales sp. CCMP2436]|nr:hypothetical protein T492DRAFT_1124367 [Pavlovales sp. CCMP2436]
MLRHELLSNKLLPKLESRQLIVAPKEEPFLPKPEPASSAKKRAGDFREKGGKRSLPLGPKEEEAAEAKTEPTDGIKGDALAGELEAGLKNNLAIAAPTEGNTTVDVPDEDATVEELLEGETTVELSEEEQAEAPGSPAPLDLPESVSEPSY